MRAALEDKGWDREVALRFEEITVGYDARSGYATFTTPNFTIGYETSGSDQPTAGDAGGNIVEPGTGTIMGSTVGGNGVPDYVEKLGFWL